MNETQSAPRDRWRAWGWKRRLLCGLAALLLGARVALPYLVERYVNKQLSGISDYSGSIGTVRMHLWRGAYSIRDVRILRSEGKVPVPLFSAAIIDFSVEWKEVFHGAVVGNVRLQNPEVNFVQGGSREQSQSGSGAPWVSTLDSLCPFDINRLEIKNGAIHFKNLEAANSVDVYLTNVWAVATNLGACLKTILCDFAAGQRTWLRCSLVTYWVQYAPSSRLANRTAALATSPQSTF